MASLVILTERITIGADMVLQMVIGTSALTTDTPQDMGCLASAAVQRTGNLSTGAELVIAGTTAHQGARITDYFFGSSSAD